MYQNSPDLNEPSFFRKGGLLMPLGPDQVHVQVGKNGDGSWYVQLDGKAGCVRSIMTPRQMFDMCCGTLTHMGYAVELKPPDQTSYEMMVAEADRA